MHRLEGCVVRVDVVQSAVGRTFPEVRGVRFLLLERGTTRGKTFSIRQVLAVTASDCKRANVQHALGEFGDSSYSV